MVKSLKERIKTRKKESENKNKKQEKKNSKRLEKQQQKNSKRLKKQEKKKWEESNSYIILKNIKDNYMKLNNHLKQLNNNNDQKKVKKLMKKKEHLIKLKKKVCKRGVSSNKNYSNFCKLSLKKKLKNLELNRSILTKLFVRPNHVILKN